MQIIVLKTLNVVFWPTGLYSEYNMFTFTAELFGSGLKSWNKNTRKQVNFQLSPKWIMNVSCLPPFFFNQPTLVEVPLYL